MQKLVSRSKFAALAGVNPSTVTRLCKTLLLRAVSGKCIDAAHPDAVEYLRRQDVAQTPPAATGLDPMYEKAIESCRSRGSFSISGIKRELKIGYSRASKIVGVMRANGLLPEKGESPTFTAEKFQEKVDNFNKTAVKLRGNAVTKQNKKNRPPPSDAYQDPEKLLLSIPEDIRAFVDMSLRDLIYKFGTDVAFLDWLKATKEIEVINEKRLKNAQTEGVLVSRELMKTGVIAVFNAVHIKLLSDGAKTITKRVVAMHDAGRSLDDCEKFVIDQISSFIRPAKARIKRVMKNA